MQRRLREVDLHHPPEVMRMRTLVAAASKYGATTEIAEKIATVLRDRGIETTVSAPDDVRDVDDFDAFVLGSGVYMGHWLKPARELAERLAPKLAGRPVWLFSSGPIGEPPMPKDQAVDITAIADQTHAREHRTFAGKLDRHRLSFPDKAIVLALRAADGDVRDWDAIMSWAAEIATELTTPGRV
jgi:menaquinone-dependent protoporphyrinogen oxidase